MAIVLLFREHKLVGGHLCWCLHEGQDEWAIGTASPPSPSEIVAVPRFVIIVDCRRVIAECLGLWIDALRPEFQAASMTTIEASLYNGILGRAAVILFGTGATVPCEDGWLREQTTWARRSKLDVPLVLLAETPNPRLAAEAVKRFHLSGYISTSSSLDLAATALRSIVGEGQQVETQYNNDALPAQPHATALHVPSPTYAKLTAREASVLELLERGLPNKLISYQLGMSPSTVKAHVHNIIVKLNVRSRTEAALIAVRPAHLAIRAGQAKAPDTQALQHPPKRD
jgi:DNA-binding NarL/FixJ family response regulator